MNSFKTFLCAVMLLGGNIGLGLAHALYIDTNPKGKLGETHEIKVYYSEFAEGTLEEMPNWFSDVENFELWLVRPDGKRVQLQTKVQNDHMNARFTPKLKGTYRLEISHITAEVPKNTAFQFNAFAQVVVGGSKKSADIASIVPDFLLVNQTPTKESNVKRFQIYLEGKPTVGVSAKVFFPSGKTKEIKSDENGEFEFKSDEKGVHFLEATIFHKSQTGKTTKEEFQSLWRCATQKFEIQ